MPVLDRRSDAVKQQYTFTAARADLTLALASLHAESRSAWRVLTLTDHQPDLRAVHAAVQAVHDAEEGVTYATEGAAA